MAYSLTYSVYIVRPIAALTRGTKLAASKAPPNDPQQGNSLSKKPHLSMRSGVYYSFIDTPQVKVASKKKLLSY